MAFILKVILLKGTNSYYSDLVCDVQSIKVGSQLDICLFLTIQSEKESYGSFTSSKLLG